MSDRKTLDLEPPAQRNAKRLLVVVLLTFAIACWMGGFVYHALTD